MVRHDSFKCMWGEIISRFQTYFPGVGVGGYKIAGRAENALVN